MNVFLWPVICSSNRPMVGMGDSLSVNAMAVWRWWIVRCVAVRLWQWRLSTTTAWVSTQFGLHTVRLMVPTERWIGVSAAGGCSLRVWLSACVRGVPDMKLPFDRGQFDFDLGDCQF